MSSNNTSTSKIDSPIFSIHIVSIEKIDGSNCSTQAFEIGLWLSGLGYKTHLTTITEFVPTKHHEEWIKIDAQLCSVIESTIYTSLKPIFCPHETCASFWSEACAIYTNYTQCLYGMCLDTFCSTTF